MSDIKIQETKKVWVVVTCSDLTEGRGYHYPLAICESEAVAKRIGKKKYIQGSDCPIRQSSAYLINGKWVSEFKLEIATEQDKKNQVIIEKRKDALKKAKEAGLTEEDIKLLR